MLIRFVRNEVLAGQQFRTGVVRDLPLQIALGCMQRGSAVRADKPQPIATALPSNVPSNIPAPPASAPAPPESRMGAPEPRLTLWDRLRAMIVRE